MDTPHVSAHEARGLRQDVHEADMEDAVTFHWEPQVRTPRLLAVCTVEWLRRRTASRLHSYYQHRNSVCDILPDMNSNQTWRDDEVVKMILSSFDSPSTKRLF